MRISYQIVMCIFYGVLVQVFAVQLAYANDKKPSQDELLSLVIGRIRQNYSLIKSADIVVDVVIDRRDAQGKLKQATWQDHVQFKGQSVRYEQHDGGKIPVIAACHDGVWQWFSLAAHANTPADNRLTITHIDALGGMTTFDPREYAVLEFKESLLNILTSKEIDSASIVESEDGRKIVEMIRKPQKEAKVKWIYTFDSAVDYLPTRVLMKEESGDLRESIEIEYQKVLNGKVLFPQKRMLKYYAIKGIKTPEDDRWNLCYSKTILKAEINKSVEDKRFKIVRVPDGTTVDDQIHKRMYLSNINRQSVPENAAAQD